MNFQPISSVGHASLTSRRRTGQCSAGSGTRTRFSRLRAEVPNPWQNPARGPTSRERDREKECLACQEASSQRRNSDETAGHDGTRDSVGWILCTTVKHWHAWRIHDPLGAQRKIRPIARDVANRESRCLACFRWGSTRSRRAQFPEPVLSKSWSNRRRLTNRSAPSPFRFVSGDGALDFGWLTGERWAYTITPLRLLRLRAPSRDTTAFRAE